MDRVHLVLVPGFAGFDALGQLEYYAGVTALFRKWRQMDAGARPEVRAVLHYFDNFPTAGVCTRAARLRQYLAQRIARGEFAPDDELVLVGHSTGGLDIRRLIFDLAADTETETRVDGGRESAVPVTGRDILDIVKRVVFLSVPHWGTNIADWVRAHHPERWLAVNDLRAAVWTSQLPVLDAIEELFAGVTAATADSDILLAAHDVLAEGDAFTGTPGPLRTADAHESAALVELWLRHMASDFSAIDDLASQQTGGDDRSPAHFPLERRATEVRLWNGSSTGRAIRTRSYVTLGRRPYLFATPPPPWGFLEPATYPALIPGESHPKTDLAYRVCYRACAGGPFTPPAIADARVAYVDSAHEDLIGEWTGGTIAAWDNDGIVNTASMVWRDNEDVVLVPGDHMDIVGHYRRERARGGNGREYQAYDLLVSASQFTDRTFEQVWDNLFAWAVRPDVARRGEMATPGSAVLNLSRPAAAL